MRSHLPRESYRNPKKRFVIQIVVVGNPVQNVLEMVVLGENASQETHSLTHLPT